MVSFCVAVELYIHEIGKTQNFKYVVLNVSMIFYGILNRFLCEIVFKLKREMSVGVKCVNIVYTISTFDVT